MVSFEGTVYDIIKSMIWSDPSSLGHQTPPEPLLWFLIGTRVEAVSLSQLQELVLRMQSVKILVYHRLELRKESFKCRDITKMTTSLALFLIYGLKKVSSYTVVSNQIMSDHPGFCNCEPCIKAACS